MIAAGFRRVGAGGGGGAGQRRLGARLRHRGRAILGRRRQERTAWGRRRQGEF